MGLLQETQTGEKVEGGDTFKIHKKSAGRNIIVLILAIWNIYGPKLWQDSLPPPLPPNSEMLFSQ